MARDAVVAEQFVLRRGRGLNVMLRLVVDDDGRITIVLVHTVRDGTERGNAQRQQQRTRRGAQQPRRESQQATHFIERSGACARRQGGVRRAGARSRSRMAGLRPGVALTSFGHTHSLCSVVPKARIQWPVS